MSSTLMFPPESPLHGCCDAQGRKQLRMEFFYREMRKKHGVLLMAMASPWAAQWNFDSENRGAFGKEGPGSTARADALQARCDHA
jgi:deoxyribodipyrimidine photolyase-related protein